MSKIAAFILILFSVACSQQQGSNLKAFSGAESSRLLGSQNSCAREPNGIAVKPATEGRKFSKVQALVFDVFGTVVDVRSSLVKQLEQIGAKHGIHIDWYRFATDWMMSYPEAIDIIRSTRSPWVNLDELLSHNLESLLKNYGISNLTASQKAELTAAWEKLQPWSDTIDALTQLKGEFIIAPLSNANISMMTRLSANVGLPWSCILSAEIAQRYKPDVEVYSSAVKALGLNSDQVMMVAAHRYDLEKPKELGMKTAFIQRSGEDFTTPGSRADIEASDLLDLVKQLAK